MSLLAASLILSQSPSGRISLNDAMGIRLPGNRRFAIVKDPVAYALATGTLEAPRYGVRLGQSVWAPIQAGANGDYSGSVTKGGCLAFTVDLPHAGIMLLHEEGASTAYVNGTPHAGDPYSFGYLDIPVQLHAGPNTLLFECGRGSFKGWLQPVEGKVLISAKDATTPDWLKGSSPTKLWLAAPVLNLTNAPLKVSVSAMGGRAEPTLAEIAPLGIRKLPVLWEPGTEAGPAVNVTVGEGAASLKITLRERDPLQAHKMTFLSEIDGSVQYYGLLPAQHPTNDDGIALSLHGASVEAIGQAEAYAPHDHWNIVAPTNRRPYGFDWEDTGRLDALEVLKLAFVSLTHDPLKVSLTGHSMGGHGTWSIGSLYPDLFASLAPSAGWISFDTYPARSVQPKNDIDRLLARASSPSDTLLRKANLMDRPVYVLHGEADDNVPASEAHRMVKELEGNPRVQSHFEPGVGHWWSKRKGPGSDCVDWPGFFEMFESSRVMTPAERTSFEFATPTPSVSSQCGWVTLQQQILPFAASSVRVHGHTIQTTNVRRMLLDLAGVAFDERVVTFQIDGTSLALDRAKPASLKKIAEVWTQTEPLSPAEKSPVRSGGFKEVFAHRFVMVYGTKGSKEEREWALSAARFHAESWLYRGNGDCEVIPDTRFDAKKYADRSVILYGSWESNSAMPKLLKGCPIQVHEGQIILGPKRILKGQNLGVAMVYPRSDSDVADVAVIGGTGLAGMRTAERLPYFTSGAGMPDYLILPAESLLKGSDADCIGGFFDSSWRFVQEDCWSSSGR